MKKNPKKNNPEKTHKKAEEKKTSSIKKDEEKNEKKTSVKNNNLKDKKEDKRNESIPIVGIGASAGGLEVFTKLLNALPANTGLAFVLVQHLSPNYESILPELLTKETDMPVHQVKNGDKVKANNFYVIPPNKDIILEDGVLNLRERQKPNNPHMPVDTFFRSLAKVQKSKAIGVILSGSGSDGTLGIRAIKAEGGLTFAQSVETAKFDGMPRSAIASGEIDFILPPEKIAKELERIGKHPYVAYNTEEEAEILTVDEKELKEIFNILRRETNIDFTDYKLNTIKRRIARRMVLHKYDDLSDYVKLLNESETEIETLYDDLLIKVTSFFREPDSFEALKETVLPKIISRKSSNKPVRIWIPGCSTGEEAYSIAIALLEYLGSNAYKTQVQIFATDISDTAIERAREGIYPENIKQDVSADRLQRFFVRTNGGFQINKALRNLCVFAKQDVCKDPPFSKMDIISCRNLLIYLTPVLQKKVIPTFHYALNPESYLLLGSSESIGKFSDLFHLIDKKHKIYEKKQASYNLEHSFALNHHAEKAAYVKNQDSILPAAIEDVEKEADKILMMKYVPPSILINEDLNIIQFRGNTGTYLEPAPGLASLNLFKMAREGLVFDLRSAILKAKKENIIVKRKNVSFKSNGTFKSTDIEVNPIKRFKSNAKYFLIIFHGKEDRENNEEETKNNAEEVVQEGNNISELENELKATKEYLESIIEQKESINEELRSALEELQSSNEELQSTNEEMETAKEELQSTNEELTTVNDELESRNEELNTANDDLTNLLSSINIPIIMLGSDLRIRRYTPTAGKLFNIIASDVHRPVSDLRMNINISNLGDLVLDVLSSLETKEIQVHDNNSNWYLMKIRPYRTVDNKIDGVVIAFLNIHYREKNITETEAALQFARAIIDKIDEPLLILHPDLKIRFTNNAFLKEFNISKEKVVDRHLHSFLDGKFDNDELKKELYSVSKKDKALKNYEFNTEFDDKGKIKILMNASKIDSPKNFLEFILLTMQLSEGEV